MGLGVMAGPPLPAGLALTQVQRAPLRLHTYLTCLKMAMDIHYLCVRG
jgi:hypothetical protein